MELLQESKNSFAAEVFLSFMTSFLLLYHYASATPNKLSFCSNRHTYN